MLPFMKCLIAQRLSNHLLTALMPAPMAEKSGQCVPSVVSRTISSTEMTRGFVLSQGILRSGMALKPIAQVNGVLRRNLKNMLLM